MAERGLSGRCHLSSEEDGKRPEVGLRNSEEARVWGARVHLRGQQGSVRWALLGSQDCDPEKTLFYFICLKIEM